MAGRHAFADRIELERVGTFWCPALDFDECFTFPDAVRMHEMTGIIKFYTVKMHETTGIIKFNTVKMHEATGIIKFNTVNPPNPNPTPPHTTPPHSNPTPPHTTPAL